jgi:hypothetical protein
MKGEESLSLLESGALSSEFHFCILLSTLFLPTHQTTPIPSSLPPPPHNQDRNSRALLLSIAHSIPEMLPPLVRSKYLLKWFALYSEALGSFITSTQFWSIIMWHPRPTRVWGICPLGEQRLICHINTSKTHHGTLQGGLWTFKISKHDKTHAFNHTVDFTQGANLYSTPFWNPLVLESINEFIHSTNTSWVYTMGQAPY